MKDTVELFSDYNSWATARTLVSLEPLAFGDYTGPGCSGHGSIRDTLVHALDAERGWVSWLDGSRSLRDARRDRLDPANHPTLQDAKRLWSDVDVQTRRLVASLDEDAVRQTWTIPSRGGGETPVSAGQLLLHVFNHGTHTRAQIVAAIRRAGFEPQPTDLVRFYLER